MRITLSADVVTSPRYTREPPHFLADFGSFSRFRLQEKHNASLFQYVLQKWRYGHKAMQRYEKNSRKTVLCKQKDGFLGKICKKVHQIYQIVSFINRL